MTETPVKEITALTVDFADPVEREEYMRGLTEAMTRRAKAAIAELRCKGIIDELGNRINTELPEDMRPGSETDFGG